MKNANELLISRAIFIDRDGVINVDRGYVCRSDDFTFLPGAIEAMLAFQQAGYRLVVVTNQSGIARGFYSELDYEVLTAHMRNELRRFGVQLSGVYHCPHLPDAPVAAYRRVCDCRKPAPGMINRAVQDLNIDVAQSILVGDKPSDISAGRAADVRFCYLISDSTPEHGDQSAKPDAIYSSLSALAEQILAKLVRAQFFQKS